ncbi:transmembrane protease serine 7 isoform X2 [Syngnathus typhle]|uniref:transmembrane protease serine 7 isoform X2 n=1 Tax=Syngnathus typhle TaxID=161592 RepID=UPI002A6B5716|nr:transmembrane protease serine 7 isoform X2 [Syngnathus typhle]
MGSECKASGDVGEFQIDTASVTDVSVEMSTVDHTLQKLSRMYRKTRRKPKGLSRLWAYLLSIQHLAVIVTAVVFVLVVILWSLLWVFIFRREGNSGVYFAGMFRVANVEFIPEYRQAGSREFVSMATKIQHVVSSVYKVSSVARLYKHNFISDLSTNSKGGVLVHFWMVFEVPRLESAVVCEECVGVILRDSVHTSLKNRSSVGYLLDLPVDIDSILINAVQRSDYTSTAAGSQCVDKLYASLPGVSVPLNIFSSWGDVRCHVKLTAVPGFLIRLTIASFQMDPSDCVHDALTAYDALLPMRGRVLHRLCTPVSSSISLVSTSNVMLLSFTMTGGSKSFRGHFEAITEELCLSRIIPQSHVSGSINSPFHPSLMPPHSSCTWIFQTPDAALGVALQLKNYVLRPKDMKGCEHGWWRVNEVIFCGSYVGHESVFRIAQHTAEVEFRSTTRRAAQPFQLSYSSYNISQPCPESHFLCSTGLCVEKSRRCDGLDDCQDESDEVFCLMPTKNCGGGSSSPLHPLFVCNGEPDCANGLDETNCTQAICSAVSFRCDSDSCIRKKNARCDDVTDCQDGSDERDCACGLPTPPVAHRIVGGSDSDEGEWPWQVSLHFSGHLICGASVLSSDWLISAAHCFSKDRLSDPRRWRAHLGALMQGSAKHVAEIQRIVPHEYYDASTLDYDMALLQLKRAWPASLGPLVQPVCLPATSQAVTAQHRCWVTGWGHRSEDDKSLPSVLQKAQVSVMSQTECKAIYGLVSPRMLCAGVSTGERDACRGDSGGPLSCQAPSGGRWFLIGIVSWGAGCGRPELPGVYTRVSKFTSWIYGHIS